MARTAQITSRKESGQTENTILYNTYFKVVTCPLWQYWLWSFQGRDTKLEMFFAKNQLSTNKMRIGVVASCQKLI